MRILIEHGTSQFDNLGDLAMLQVTLQRLGAMWPEASLRVITRADGPVPVAQRNVSPIRIRYPAAWLNWRRFLRAGGGDDRPGVGSGIEAVLSQALPAPFQRDLAKAVDDADLVVHAGSGILADPFLPAALRRLQTFSQAQHKRRPTAFFSQGVGPVKSRLLRRSLRSGLRQAQPVSLRDARSRRVLSSVLGADPISFSVTGDDALALGTTSTPGQPGTGLGVNLRLASYSGVGRSDVELFSQLISELGRMAGSAISGFVPLKVHASDVSGLAEWSRRTQVGPIAPAHAFSVAALVRAIQGCRLVVTGSYHAAVLALGMGIPAVCVFKSDYYLAKFSGLAELFDSGTCLIRLEPDLDAAAALSPVLDLWNRAGELRPGILARAADWVEASAREYRRLKDLIDAAV
jgi:polysaccharide pyruvyl transferase WcaK-like protein